MKTNKYKINEKAYLTSYVFDDYRVDIAPRIKPAVIICPGGGWMYLSEREGEPVAIEFARKGYYAFVLHYSVSDEKAENGNHELVTNAIGELDEAFKLVSDLADENHINPKRISILGFSAGGQLAALYSSKCADIFSCILCYPLLDVDSEYSYVCSEKCPEGNKALMEKCFSIMGIGVENNNWNIINPIANISENMPDTFIWHGLRDNLVPAEGSVNYARSLIDNNCRVELHIFDNCGHGVSLGTKETAAAENEINDYCTVWWKQMFRWMEVLENEKK